MELIDLAKKLRPIIDKAAASLDDATALEAVTLFPVWSAADAYGAGDRVRYDGVLYRCLTAHTAQETWTPTDAPSLWAKVLVSDDGAILPWEQPDSTNTYSIGDKVTHNGKTWVSIVDLNSYEPGVYGWEEVVT